MMKRLLWTIALALGWALLFAGVVHAQEGGTSAATSGSVALLLAPLVAAATAIERLIEMLFNWYESVVLNARTFLGLGGNYLQWIQKEIEHYRSTVVALSATKDGKYVPADPRLLREAEEKLASAQDRLLEWLKSPAYTSWKRVISLFLGIVLGVILAFATRLRMFELLGVYSTGIPENLAAFLAGADMFVTGLIIGTGSAPVHALIGLLQNTKDAVDQARALWSGKALREVEGVLRELQAEGARRVAVEEILKDERVIKALGEPQAVTLARGLAAARDVTVPTEAAEGGLSEVEIKRMANRLLR